MQSLLADKSPSPNIDSYQKSFPGAYITSQYFMWTCLVLFLNRKNWKRPVVMVLFLHWFLRSTGDVLLNVADLMPRYFDDWPFSNEGWIYPFGIASVFWYLSEIIGDWYPLLRTKAIIKNPQKIKMVYLICILYNMVKVVQLYYYFTFIPFRVVMYQQTNDNYNEDLARFKARQWTNVMIQLIISFFYDLIIIFLMRTQLFNKMKQDYTLNNYNNNNNNRRNSQFDKHHQFLTRFKFISEYRIVISMAATIIAFPVLLGFSFLCIKKYRGETSTIDDNSADGIRQCVLSINYTLMYIDQILLRFFVEQNGEYRKVKKEKSSFILSTSTSSLSSGNFNSLYMNQSNRNFYDYNITANSYGFGNGNRSRSDSYKNSYNTSTNTLRNFVMDSNNNISNMNINTTTNNNNSNNNNSNNNNSNNNNSNNNNSNNNNNNNSSSSYSKILNNSDYNQSSIKLNNSLSYSYNSPVERNTSNTNIINNSYSINENSRSMNIITINTSHLDMTTGKDNKNFISPLSALSPITPKNTSPVSNINISNLFLSREKEPQLYQTNT
eukprot:jgi/Orpsp1_1/1185881/evm.model.c7180000095808.1